MSLAYAFVALALSAFPLKTTVVITTEPVRTARIYVGATHVGGSPTTIELAPGRYTITARLAGHQPSSKHIDLRRKRSAEVQLQLSTRTSTPVDQAPSWTREKAGPCRDDSAQFCAVGVASDFQSTANAEWMAYLRALFALSEFATEREGSRTSQSSLTGEQRLVGARLDRITTRRGEVFARGSLDLSRTLPTKAAQFSMKGTGDVVAYGGDPRVLDASAELAAHGLVWAAIALERSPFKVASMSNRYDGGDLQKTANASLDALFVTNTTQVRVKLRIRDHRRFRESFRAPILEDQLAEDSIFIDTGSATVEVRNGLVHAISAKGVVDALRAVKAAERALGITRVGAKKLAAEAGAPVIEVSLEVPATLTSRP